MPTHQPDPGPWKPEVIPRGVAAGFGAPQPLGAPVAASYTPAASFAMLDKDTMMMAYYDWDISRVHRIDLDHPTQPVPLREEHGDYISAVLANDARLIFLVGQPRYAYDGAYSIYFGDTETEEGIYRSMPRPEHDFKPIVGPMLMLPDGRILFADTQRHLNVAEVDSDPEYAQQQRISDIAMGEFVYHNEYVYFLNWEDTVAYKQVWCEEIGEYEDHTLPTLYRMRLDGSSMEKLADCGAQGLTSWGPYIVYQNMDAGYMLALGERPEIYFYGEQYLFDARTLSHRPLGITAPWVTPTAYGIVAWYEDFIAAVGEHSDYVYQPALYDYEGRPLHRLDIGAYDFIRDVAVGQDGIWVMSKVGEIVNEEVIGTVNLAFLPLDGGPLRERAVVIGE